MKRLALALPLVAAACGDGVEAKLARCKDGIRAELAALVEKTRSDTAESLKALEGRQPAGGPHDATEPAGKLSDSTIRALPEMLASAVHVIEAQLTTFEPTEAGLSQCQAVLAQARRR